MSCSDITEAQAIALRDSLMRIMRVALISERRFPVAGRNARYSPLDFQTLGYLQKVGSARAGEVGKHLEVAPTTMTGVIDRLEAAGLIRRIPDADDARATRLTLTETGRTMSAAIVNQDILTTTAMLGALTAEEREPFLSMLDRMAARIEQLV